MKLFVFFSFLLVSCATTVSSEMLSDGNTWRVNVKPGGFPAPCKITSSVEECMEAAKPVIESSAKEICGGVPSRYFACGRSEIGGYLQASCNVKCKDTPEINIKNVHEKIDESKAVLDSDKKSILQKAKTCQTKGGVWVNNRCEIEIGD